MFVLCTLPRWAEMCSPWRHWSQSNSAVWQVTFISHVLGRFVPMCMEVWEGGFERRGSKHVLNVARWFDVVYLLFSGPRKLLSSMAVILLYDQVLEMYFMTITWGVSAQCAEPGGIQRQLVHLCCRAWSRARTQLSPGGSTSLLGYLFAAANIIVLVHLHANLELALFISHPTC